MDLIHNSKLLQTESVKQRALDCMEQNTGLDIYAESGDKILKERIKLLSEFKAKITSPLPKIKKIKLNINSTTIIFNRGYDSPYK